MERINNAQSGVGSVRILVADFRGRDQSFAGFRNKGLFDA